MELAFSIEQQEQKAYQKNNVSGVQKRYARVI